MALKRLKASGRRLLLVTGQELDELLGCFPAVEMFDRVVAENGAMVYDPASKDVRLLAPAPPPAFAAELGRRGVPRVAVGRVIVATWEPHESTVLDVIRDLGLELQVIFNKGAVMVLPSGVNKATGLAAALTDLGLSAHNVVGVGDAENDHAFLAAVECAVDGVRGRGRVDGALYITVHPGSVAPAVLDAVNTLIAVGESPAKTVGEFCTAAGAGCPKSPAIDKLPSGDAVVWQRGTPTAAVVHTLPPTTERKRHSRKYAEGNLGPDRSFYFREPEGRLKLKAQNLAVFLQRSDGVDDETWEFHRGQADYSRWVRECVKDAELAEEVAAAEAGGGSVDEARAAVRAAVEQRYTLPTDAPSGEIDPPTSFS